MAQKLQLHNTSTKETTKTSSRRRPQTAQGPAAKKTPPQQPHVKKNSEWCSRRGCENAAEKQGRCHVHPLGSSQLKVENLKPEAFCVHPGCNNAPASGSANLCDAHLKRPKLALDWNCLHHPEQYGMGSKNANPFFYCQVPECSQMVPNEGGFCKGHLLKAKLTRDTGRAQREEKRWCSHPRCVAPAVHEEISFDKDGKKVVRMQCVGHSQQIICGHIRDNGEHCQAVVILRPGEKRSNNIRCKKHAIAVNNDSPTPTSSNRQFCGWINDRKIGPPGGIVFCSKASCGQHAMLGGNGLCAGHARCRPITKHQDLFTTQRFEGTPHLSMRKTAPARC